MWLPCRAFLRSLNHADVFLAYTSLLDEVIMPEGDVQAIFDEHKMTTIFDYYDFPEHMSKLRQRSANNQIFMQCLTNEEIENAKLAGELARYKTLAKRVRGKR